MDQLGAQVGLTPGHIVLDGDPAPPPPRGTAPQFSAHMCCGQMARWIKMPFDRKVVLNQSDIVLDGDPALSSPKKGAEPPPPIFCPCLLRPNGWMDQDATWYKGHIVLHGQGHIVLNGDPDAPKGAQPPPIFGPLIVYCGQTVAHLG